jgi:D-sedoheptulose 7-phosphate isomerase
MASAIIIAGGLGTRLRDVVSDVPKPMAPINGRPFLEYQLDHWIGQGVRRFVLSVGYKKEIIIGHFGTLYRDALIEYAEEETPLGTGGGLLLAVRILKPEQPFLVINGDTFFPVSLEEIQNSHEKRQADLTIAMFMADLPDRYGKITCKADGRINDFPNTKAQLGEAANGGVYLISPEAIEQLSYSESAFVSLEQELIPELIAKGEECYGIICKEKLMDIGTPEDYIKAGDILGRKCLMQKPANILQKNLQASLEAKRLLLDSPGVIAQFSLAAEKVAQCYLLGGRIYIAGNGGSAADAQHLAAEFVSKLAKGRAPLPAEALTVDSSVITAIGNDYGYDQIFSRQIEGKMTRKDIFLGITTSGESPNIIKALQTCRIMGIASVTFCGHDGGTAKSLADYCIIAPGKTTGTIQELHIVLAHSLCEYVEQVIFGEIT